jgi:magnesium transporter
MIYFTELENLPTFDVKGEYLGRLVDLGINPSHNSLQVATYLVKAPTKQVLCIGHDQVQSVSVRALQTNVRAGDVRCDASDEGIIRIRKDVVDQQIIDVNHQKVVRVNDVDFDIQPSDRHTHLRLTAVNVGWAAAVRRLLQGLLAKHTIRLITNLFPSKTIAWEFVNLIEPDPSRRVKLRISYGRLAKIHPADLADILEELSREEQRSVIESLDNETAAQAISEVPTRMQVALVESISPERASDIVEEMPRDKAADLLQGLSPEISAELLAKMELKDANELRNLLGFEKNTAGGLMTTQLVLVGNAATVEGAVEALRLWDGPLESVQSVYLIDSNCILTGVVPLAQILLAEANTVLQKLSTTPIISVPSDADGKTVVELFHKYNLLTLPVVDDGGRILGVVTADDVLELMLRSR